MEKFKGKYRIKSRRLQGWDYSSNGYYFLTIVTQHRICLLGKIESNLIYLSDIGKIVKREFLKSFEIRKELFLDEYIIMPNHLHMIVILNKNNGIVETHGLHYRQQQKNFYRLPKSISSFMAGFKSAVNTKINDYIDAHNINLEKFNKSNHFFQPNYYDRIIRNETEYQRIKNYIRQNPLKWGNDRFNG